MFSLSRARYKQTGIRINIDKSYDLLMNKYSYLLDLMEDLNITLCWIDNKKVKTYNKLNKNINWIN